MHLSEPVAQRRFGSVRGHTAGVRVRLGAGFCRRDPHGLPRGTAIATEEGQFLKSQPMTTQVGSLLVVDDDEFSRQGLARHLERHGYSVSGAAGGREAVELLGCRRFDLVLLDVMMPG